MEPKGSHEWHMAYLFSYIVVSLIRDMMDCEGQSPEAISVIHEIGVPPTSNDICEAIFGIKKYFLLKREFLGSLQLQNRDLVAGAGHVKSFKRVTQMEVVESYNILPCEALIFYMG